MRYSSPNQPRIAYTVTFEFSERSPMTHRGTVPGRSPATFMRRAVEQARRALAPVGWTSCVCVIDRGATPAATSEQ